MKISCSNNPSSSSVSDTNAPNLVTLFTVTDFLTPTLIKSDILFHGSSQSCLIPRLIFCSSESTNNTLDSMVSPTLNES